MMTEFKSKTHKRIIWLAAPILMMMLIASNITDFNKDRLPKDLELAEEEEFTLFFGEERINLNEGISKAQLLNNQNESLRLIFREEIAKNVKLVELTGVKGRRGIETLQYRKDNAAKEVRFNIMTAKFEKVLQTDGTCRLIILFEFIKPGFEQDYYERLGVDKYDIKPKGLALLNTDNSLSEKYPDLIERKVRTIPIR